MLLGLPACSCLPSSKQDKAQRAKQRDELKGSHNQLTCIFTMALSENAGLVAAETAIPRKSDPRAVGSLWLRLPLFYLLGSLMVTINVSPDDENLVGAEGMNASPFVVAYRNAGIPVLAHMMNAIILISVISCGSISGYVGARTTMGLAYLAWHRNNSSTQTRLGDPGLALCPRCSSGVLSATST